MEPLALRADTSGLIRPANVLQADVRAVLREGRILAGEVLDTFGGGSLVVGIGGHKVPAQSQLELLPGQRFLFQVERSADGLLLRLLPAATAADGALLRALRGVVAQDRPVGELLESLAASLRAQLARPARDTAPTARLQALLADIEAHVLTPGATGAELMRLLGRAGLTYEAVLLQAAQGGATDDLGLLGEDLKAQLLSALEDLPPGPAREAVARALAGLEAEQLLNLARAKSGEALHWSLPLPDGAHWSTAHLFVRRDRESEGEGQGEERREDVLRVVVGLELSRTGRVRADLYLRAKSLGVRFLAESEAVAGRLRGMLEPLRATLADAGFSVQLSAAVGEPEQLDVETRALDIEYLREHRLMDLEG